MRLYPRKAQTERPVALGVLLDILTPASLALAIAWIVIVRRQCRRMAYELRQRIALQELRPLEESSAAMGNLGRTVNELLELADRSAGDAARQMKEMEIQLKVASTERQDAQAIVHSISDAVLVTDPFDELVMANDSAARVFQFETAKARGARLDHLVKDPKMVELIRDMRLSDSHGGRRVVEHSIRSGDGPEADRTYKITLSCVNNRDQQCAGVVVVLHDTTREREVAQMKNEFVSNVSHELRTPLASIKAYVEMLLDGEANDEKTAREFHEVIQSEANRLSRLIDNILSISRIESGLVQVNRQPQSLTVILKEAIEVIAPQARSKRISVVEKLTPVFYQTVADRDMLYQAVLNLLSNAVKYTPEGGTIAIETLVDEAAGNVVTRISDSGVGIPPKDLPLVFDKFYRSEANNHMAKGTGLGLSLVKHIIETVHKGRLFVQSEVGKGSCFGFELRLAK
jgi:two-component system, OmpR family, phosphate regulon sensor histidine kinase PhoR